MANHSREDMEKQGNAEIGLGAALLGLIGLGIAGGVAASNQKKEEQRRLEQIKTEISNIDRQINEYKSQFLGSWLNSDQIEVLESKRRALVEEQKKLIG